VPRCAHPPVFLDIDVLRPLSTPHPFPPHELALFDTHVRFVTAAPGGLIKPKEPIEEWTDEVKKQFKDANTQRMQDLVDANGANALFIYTDGSREEEQRGRNPERCAGAFVVCSGPRPNKRSVKHEETVPAAPIACVYTAELLSIDKALAHVIANYEVLFAHRPKRLVLVTDSKSSLESMRTTWLSRINRKEQDAVRKLHDLALLGIHTTLAFVFSHVGGAPGNDYVDKLATAGCTKYGTLWRDPVWNIDTTRRVLRNRHETVDKALAHAKGAKFRFRNVPDSVAPSGDLPLEMPRWKERLVYRARVGMLPAAGGMLHGVKDDCPFCRAPAALGRDGKTIEHLVECVPRCAHPPVFLDIDDFWSDPNAAASALATTTKLAQALNPREYHVYGRQH
jgi:ribonuclease HI